MSNDLNRSIKIYIDGTEAALGVKQVETAIQKLENKLASLNKSEANYNTQSRKLQQEINKKTTTLEKYKQSIRETERILSNLSGATYNELISVQSKVRKQLRDAIPGTQQHSVALEQNRRVTEALPRAQAAMRVEVGCQGTVWGQAANFVNKYMALIGGVVASVTGLSMTIRRSVDDYAQISEAMAGVKKYTGMTDEAVKDLNEDLKKIDTRTPRERLNELAQDAGRLGIQGKQDILDFVDAADKINVALGEDLGEDAVKNIGKLAQMFGEDKTLGLRGAMLATGSAINEVAQNSSAAESYLVDFTARVSGTGKQAGISQTQIMGFASVLDQDMQQVEMASTALQTVIMKVYQEPAKFAKMAGKDVKDFTKLLKEDANEALLQLLENLGSKGGLQQLAPLFKDMKLDGVRAAGVLNTLAANTAKIREEQERATTAYKEGTSVINEFNVQNNTVQARLDKAKNGFKEVSYQLGEKMLPLMSNAITATSFFVRALNSLIEFIARYSHILIPLTATIATYVLICKAQIIEEKLKVFWNQKVIATLKEMYAVMLRNPYLAVAAVIVTLISALSNMNKEMTESERIEKSLTEIRNNSKSNIQDERNEVEHLLSVARNENLSKAEREAAIRRLNEISPEYLGNLSLETINTEQATAAVNSYVDSLLVLEEIKQTQKKISELRDRKDDLSKNGPDNGFWSDLEAGAANMLNGFKTSLGLTTDAWADNVLNEYINKGTNELRSLDREIQTLNQHIEESREKLIKIESEKPQPVKNNSTTEEDDDDEKALKKRLEREKVLYTQKQAFLKAMYLEGGDETLQTEKQLNKELECLQMEHLENSLKIAGTKSKEGIEIQNQINDLKLKIQKEHTQELIDQEKIDYERQQQELKELYASGKDENLNSEAAYNDAMEQLTVMHLERMLSLAGLNAEQRKQVEKQLLDYKVKCIQKDQKANEQNSKNKLKTDKQEFEERLRIYQQYGEEFGNALGNIISGQENAMQGFADTMIDIMFDVIAQIINAELVNLGIIGTAEAAKATAKEIGSKGFWGIASGAILAGLITAGIATAKSTLKGFIGKRRDSGSSSTESTPQAEYKINQRAAGKYDVIGAEDGRSYHDIPYIGEAPTGIVKRTSLISENGSELIINSEDLSRLQKHINYPVVLQAINDARSGRVPQYAEGNYDSISHSTGSPTPPSPNNNLEAKLEKVMDKMDQVMDKLGKPSKNYVLLSDINDAEEIKLKSEKPFTRGDQ